MSGPEHVIDIDSIVLDGIDATRRDRAVVLLEAQLAGALAGVPADIRSLGVRGGAGIAREVARAVIGALPGTPNGT